MVLRGKLSQVKKEPRIDRVTSSGISLGCLNAAFEKVVKS